MAHMEDLPAWLRPATLDGWPTQMIVDTGVRVALPIRRQWSPSPLVQRSPVDLEHAYPGVYPSEWCIVNFMEHADPAQDIRTWLDAILQLTGFPVPRLAEPYPTSPALLAWESLGPCPAYAAHLDADEAHLYQGLAHLPDKPAEVARIYVVLLRSGTRAWKITLSFMSACLPGTPEEMVESNDHVRAGATFGYLCLLDEESG